MLNKIHKLYFQILCRILTSNVLNLSESCVVMNSPILSDPSTIPSQRTVALKLQYAHWSVVVEKLARELNVDPDDLRCHHVCELYSSGLDTIAEEVFN